MAFAALKNKFATRAAIPALLAFSLIALPANDAQAQDTTKPVPTLLASNATSASDVVEREVASEPTGIEAQFFDFRPANRATIEAAMGRTSRDAVALFVYGDNGQAVNAAKSTARIANAQGTPVEFVIQARVEFMQPHKELETRPEDIEYAIQIVAEGGILHATYIHPDLKNVKSMVYESGAAWQDVLEAQRAREPARSGERPGGMD